MKVIVLRGISGAGKSTWVSKNYPTATVVSADDYFRKDDGTYEYDRAKIDEAHEECYRLFSQAIQNKDPLIVVDNSNVTIWEISPYVMPAQSFGYEVEIITLACDPEVAIKRKDWLTPDRVRAKARLLEEETAKLPDFMKKIHKEVKND